jgi:hypothetical protein
MGKREEKSNREAAREALAYPVVAPLVVSSRQRDVPGSITVTLTALLSDDAAPRTDV